MANYIQGAPQDYIPQIQNFKPDLNFYSNVLQTKQSQYDSAYHQINKAYGTLLQAPMLGEDNIARRDKFFKDMEGDVKKISKLDLSQESNVNAAMQAFAPIYNDKDMVNDMVVTKRYQNNLQIGENLKSCIDPDKCGGSYWDVGMAQQQYWAKDFKNATRQERLSMQPPDFAAKIDVEGKMAKFAKELNLDVVSEQTNGQWIIKQKNGSLIEKPLHNALMAKFGNDPEIQKMYRAQAFVERKSAVESMIPEYGNADAAESAYLGSKYAELTKRALNRDMQQKEQVSSIDNRSKIKEKQIKTYGIVDPNSSMAVQWAAIQAAKQNAEEASKVTERGVDLIKAPLSGDKKALAMKVDNLLADDYLHAAVHQGAHNWAESHASITREADSYGVAGYNHQLRMSEQEANHKFEWEKMFAKNKLDIDRDNAKYNRDNQSVNANITASNSGGAGTSTHEFSTRDSNQAKVMEKIRENNHQAAEYTSKTLNKFVNTINNSDNTDSVTYAKKAFKQITGMDWEKANTSEKTFDVEEFSNKASVKNFLAAKSVVDSYRKDFGVGQTTVGDGSNRATGQDPFVSSIDDLEGRMKKTQDVISAVQTLNNKNDKAILSAFQTDASLNEDLKAVLPMAFKDGKMVSEGQFVKSYGDTYAAAGGTTTDAIDAYQAVKDKYSEYEKASTHVRHYSQDPNVSQGSGGLTTKPLQLTADLRHNNEGTQVLSGMNQDLNEGNVAKIVFGTADEVNDKAYGKLEDDPNAKLAFQTFYNKVLSKEIGGGKQSPVADVKYMGIAANNPNMVAYQVTLPQEFLHSHEIVGSKETPGIGREGLPNTITMYVPANKTKNPIYEKTKTSDEDIILNAKGPEGITISNYPTAGKVNIVKKTDGSGYKIGGSYNFVNDKGEMDSFTQDSPDLPAYLNAKTVVEQMTYQLAQRNDAIHKKLMEVHQNNPKNERGQAALEKIKTQFAQ